MSVLQGAPRQSALLKQLSRKQHQIPSYQRPYVWQPERTVDLLNDLWEASEPNENGSSTRKFFLGSLVLVTQGGEGAGAGKPDVINVVDGQQRITTLSIIAAVTLDIIAKEGFSNSVFETEEFGDDGGNLRTYLETCLRTQHKPPKPILNVRSGDAKSWRSIAISAGTGIIESDTRHSHAFPSQYTRNYDAVYSQLSALAKIYPINPIIIKRLFDFSAYLVKNVEVVIMEAVDETAALQIFGVVNTPGEALDLSSMLKWKLTKDLRTDEDELDADGRKQEAEEMEKDWADFEADLDTAKDEAALAMCRAWACTYHLDATLVPRVVQAVFVAHHPSGPQDYPAADTLGRAKLLADYFRRCFGIFKALHNVARDGTAVTDVDKAFGRLMALQSMATSADAKMKGAIWQAVAVAVLTAMEVEGNACAATLTRFDAEGEKAKVLHEVLSTLEVILLRAYLSPSPNKSTKNYIRERMSAALNSAWRLKPTTSLAQLHGNDELSGLRVQEDDKPHLATALSGALYNLGGMKDVAMRHIVMLSCFLEQDFNMRRTQTRQTTRAAFRVDWTVEHIFPQSGAGAINNEERTFFLNPELGMPVHFLGNLTPLETSLNSAANSKSFKEKKRLVYKDSQFSGVHHLSVLEKFGRAQFEDRHNSLKSLVFKSLGIDESARRLASLSPPVMVGAAGEEFPADFLDAILACQVAEELDHNTVADLRAFCRAMRLSTAGTKAAVAARIVKYNSAQTSANAAEGATTALNIGEGHVAEVADEIVSSVGVGQLPMETVARSVVGAGQGGGHRRRTKPVIRADITFNVDYDLLTRDLYSQALMYRDYRQKSKNAAGKTRDELLAEWDSREETEGGGSDGRPLKQVWTSLRNAAIRGWQMIHDSPVKEIARPVACNGNRPYMWEKWYSLKSPPTCDEFKAALEADYYCALATGSLDESDAHKIEERLQAFDQANGTVNGHTWNSMFKRCKAYFDFIQELDSGRITLTDV
jgi:hypothetical protein